MEFVKNLNSLEYVFTNKDRKYQFIYKIRLQVFIEPYENKLLLHAPYLFTLQGKLISKTSNISKITYSPTTMSGSGISISAKEDTISSQVSSSVELKLDTWVDIPLTTKMKIELPQRGQVEEIYASVQHGWEVKYIEGEQTKTELQTYASELIQDGLKLKLIEKSISNPINTYPNNNTIDVTKPNIFRFEFRGQELQSYCINIYDEYGNQVYTTDFISFDANNYKYNGEFIEHKFDNLSSLGLENKKRYYWKALLSQFSPPLYPDVYVNFETVGYYFYASGVPEVKLFINETEIPKTENTVIVQNKNLNAYVKYYSTEHTGIKYYSFYLKNELGEIIDKKEKIFSGKINYSQSNLLSDKQYILHFVLETQIGQLIEREIVLQVNYIEKIDFDYQLQLKVDKIRNAVRIDFLKGTPKSSAVKSFEIVRIEGNNPIGYSLGIFSTDSLQSGASENRYIVYDYGVRNNQEYTYKLYPITDIGYSSPSISKIVTYWDGYTIYPLIYNKEESKYNLDVDTEGHITVWNFYLNCEEGDISLIQDKTYFESFSKKPKVSIGETNYHKGSLNCLLGNVRCTVGEQTTLFEPNLLLDKWNNFIENNPICLFKNTKGDTFVVSIDNFTRKYMTKAANLYNDEYLEENVVTVYPTTINFSYTEIDEIEKINVAYIGE